MRTNEQLDALEREGRAFADTLRDTSPDLAVRTCPDWSVRDLAHHLGGVHRKVRRYVVERRTERIEPGLGPFPADDALESWFREGVAGVVEALREVDDDLACFTHWPTDSPRAMWARRQAHETAIHRADLLSAIDEHPHYDPAFACDGIGELLGPYLARPAWRPVTASPFTIRVEPEDAPQVWSIRVTPDVFEVVPEARPADVCVRGPASDLYLLLWNRGGTDGLKIDGDHDVVEQWRTSTQAAPQKSATSR